MSAGDLRSDADPFDVAMDVSSRDGFTVEVQRPAPAVILLRVEGELDLWTSLPLLDAILAAVGERPGLIVVDMSSALSMDDTGLRVLVQGSRRVEEERIDFAVVCLADSAVDRFLERVDARRSLSIHLSADDALRPWLDGAGELPAGV